jgi:hypothetical protein
MNPNYQEFKFPQIRAYPWGSIFKPSTSPESIDLIGKLLAYVPDRRLKAIEVNCSVCFSGAYFFVKNIFSKFDLFFLIFFF